MCAVFVISIVVPTDASRARQEGEGRFHAAEVGSHREAPRTPPPQAVERRIWRKSNYQDTRQCGIFRKYEFEMCQAFRET